MATPHHHPDHHLAPLREAARAPAEWNWYAIADSAQQRLLPAAIVDAGRQVRCLLGGQQDTPVARQSPHLVDLASPLDGGPAWDWISVHARRSPCVTILASALPFASLFDQLATCTEAVLPDGEAMFFGFWDPAILGTLVGQPDDATLHVPGPVLDASQRAVLLANIGAWWYWDRDGGLHRIAPAAQDGPLPGAPLRLDQAQVDALVEASVPDHVLYFLELNQPLLLEPVPKPARYRMVSDALVAARAHGLVAMQDMVNFACAALIYAERFDSDPLILALLADVKRGSLAFPQALEQMP